MTALTVFIAIALACSKTYAQCTFNSTSALAGGKSSCSGSAITLQDIAVPAGETLDLTGFATGTVFNFAGRTTFGYDEWAGPLISVDGTGVNVTGSSGHVIDCDGARWWDGLGGNGGKIKPKFFKVKLKNAKINKLNIKNTPVHAFSVNGCTNVTIDEITLDNSDGDTEGGHNTDAFDVGSSTNVAIKNCNIKNQDDCLAVNSGVGIEFTSNTCSGGHGISVGSVGGRSDNVVQGVTVKDCTITDSDNGIRIKTVSDATGIVDDIHYSNIQMTNIRKKGIVIQQDYLNGSPTGIPTGGVPITNVELKDITGTVVPSGTDIYILCANCSNWKWSNVNVYGGKKSTACQGVPLPASC